MEKTKSIKVSEETHQRLSQVAKQEGKFLNRLAEAMLLQVIEIFERKVKK